MSLSKHYDPNVSEPKWMHAWQAAGIYHFEPDSEAPIYSIDTPPPTVSGNLHLGHTYSYTHPDLVARFRRMRGSNVYYPMGYDDNGLPTERLVEKLENVKASQIGRSAFIDKCLQVSEQVEQDYQELWQRLGLSIDFRYSYRTIDANSRRISQKSFIELYQAGLAYRREAPAIWCPECRTSIAQADLEDLERWSEFVTLRFTLTSENNVSKNTMQDGVSMGTELLVATTRPELLAACVAVFVHPSDLRYKHIAGHTVRVPIFGQLVPVLSDSSVDQAKGTGAVMCCTFGDQADVAWWYSHKLPLIEAINRDGTMTSGTGIYAGMKLEEARQQIKLDLEQSGQIENRQPTSQSIRVHERCDTPVEYIITRQWFIKVLENKDDLSRLGEQVHWFPEQMQKRYHDWVENLNWDWSISRQRYYGVPFPVWYCHSCGETLVAQMQDLPIDPLSDSPPGPCHNCGSREYLPEEDVLDTWATSSLTPQIVGRQGDPDYPDLFQRVFPFSLRPQAHEIIRTWAFYTITKSHYHTGLLPWQDVLISGWGIAGEGMGKISKSRGGGPMSPMEMIQRYSADAVRYWAASTSPGKDAIISEEKIKLGARLITKLWNVARFAERFIKAAIVDKPTSLSPADRWILSRLQKLVQRTTDLLEVYEFAAAKAEIETFFWIFTDNYLEMAKQRLYDLQSIQHAGAIFTLHITLDTLLKLLAPYLPFVTDEIYQELFISQGELRLTSIHRAKWPEPQAAHEDSFAEQVGEALVLLATAVRRFKSERGLSLGSELSRLQIVAPPRLGAELRMAVVDLISICRVHQIDIVEKIDPGLLLIDLVNSDLQLALEV